MNESLRNAEIVSSIKWYFESKNKALKNALAIQCPLSVEAKIDLRIYYSQYFSSLLAATELLLEDQYPHKAAFEKQLHTNLSFQDFPDGKENYLYLKELRNTIVHRGYDITSSSHIASNFPLFIAPENVMSRNGRSVYKAYGVYVLDIIKKTENVIGQIFLLHIDEAGLLMGPEIPTDEILEQIITSIEKTKAMPDWAKKMALEALPQINIDSLMNKEMYLRNLKAVLTEKII